MPECGPDCTETLLEVEAFLDGEVDPALAERIKGHLPIAARARIVRSSAST